MRVSRAVYRAALAVEFRLRNIPFMREVSYPLSYGGEPLHLYYRADFVCFSSVIVEVKALSAIGNAELAQAINYLKVSRLERGLILNFGAPSLHFRRVVLANRRKSGPTTGEQKST